MQRRTFPPKDTWWRQLQLELAAAALNEPDKKAVLARRAGNYDAEGRQMHAVPWREMAVAAKSAPAPWNRDAPTLFR